MVFFIYFSLYIIFYSSIEIINSVQQQTSINSMYKYCAPSFSSCYVLICIDFALKSSLSLASL
jgi:hypothetical protein